MNNVGQRLQQAREARGMSIEDVARVTRISRATIEAIEAGNRAALPADVYVRGFTRTIALTVGLEPRDVLITQPVIEPELVAPAVPTHREEQRFAMLFGYEPSQGPLFGTAHILAAVVAIGLFVAAWLLVGSQPTSHTTAHDSQGGVPAIQEHVDAVTPFTAQGLRADARR